MNRNALSKHEMLEVSFIFNVVVDVTIVVVVICAAVVV